MKLYAVTGVLLNKKWGLCRNKRQAIRIAKLNKGTEVWEREMPEGSPFSWLIFCIGATRIYPR